MKVSCKGYAKSKECFSKNKTYLMSKQLGFSIPIAPFSDGELSG